MVHKMGLAAMTLGSKSVPNVQYHNSSGTLLSGNTDGNTQTVNAAAFSGTNLPYAKNGVNYEIVKNSMTFTGSGNDGWTYTATVAAGNYVSQTIQSQRTFIYKGWVYEFTGGIQSLAITQTGSYTLEVWGAQGGNINSTWTGGLGGKMTGTITFSGSTTLYVVVGGQGAHNSNMSGAVVSTGGYNGGGNSMTASGYSANLHAAGGGGATHIATATGVLSSLSSSQETVLIVAGGGGGGNYAHYADNNYYHSIGGTGGGDNGGSATTGETSASVSGGYNGWNYIPTPGGGQSQAASAVGGEYFYKDNAVVGTFGQGGLYTNNATNSGGGGGWYGGAGARNWSGGGGSGHMPIMATRLQSS